MSLQTAASTSGGASIHVNILVPLELYAPVCSYLIENAALSRAPIYADQKGIQAAAIAGQQPVRTQQAARLKPRRTQGKRPCVQAGTDHQCSDREIGSAHV